MVDCFLNNSDTRVVSTEMMPRPVVHDTFQTFTEPEAEAVAKSDSKQTAG
jgi:hypothetical protein